MAPSLTAQGVARARARMARPSTSVGDPDGEARLNVDLGADPDAPVGPLFRHLTVRTTFFDALTLAAVETGNTQVVIVGAGYDCRALRFRRQGVRFFEVDHPATQHDKQQRLARLEIAAVDVAYVALDLATGDIDAALAAAGHDAARPSLIVCEGLLLYLDVGVIERLFVGLRRRVTGAATLALSLGVDRLAVTGPDIEARRAAWDDHLRSIGEPPRTRLPLPEWDTLLAGTGWSLDRVVDPHDLDPEIASGGARLVTAAPAPPRSA